MLTSPVTYSPPWGDVTLADSSVVEGAGVSLVLPVSADRDHLPGTRSDP